MDRLGFVLKSCIDEFIAAIFIEQFELIYLTKTYSVPFLSVLLDFNDVKEILIFRWRS